MYNKRIATLCGKLSQLSADAILVMNPDNVYYLSGYTGSAGYLALTQEKIFLLTDFRYLEQAAAQAPHCTIVDIKNDFYKTLNNVLNNVHSTAFEEDFLTVKQFEKLQGALNCQWVPLAGTLHSLRIVKDEQELDNLRTAAKIADEAFIHILDYLKPGVSELEIAAELEYFMRKKGSEGPSFSFIVASGIRGAMPHGVASEKKIALGDMVTLDYGAIYKGYHSDITRTVAVGEPHPQLRKIYDIVLNAQVQSLAMVRAGAKCKEIDAQARSIISSAGYGENFGHGLGHGLGLEIHEEPRLNTKDETLLQPGMVVTVEPGIYIPNTGGVRIEDSLIVKDDGYELLTHVAKELIIL